jgi:2-dehydro-3-deoxygluconokinase
VAGRAGAAGVSARHIQFTDVDRVGLFFLEHGAAPRPSAILYDRAESAMARIEPGMIDWPKVFDGSVWFYTTGITAALSPTAADATLEALRAAKAAGLITCLDPNYRAKLWTVEAARAWLAEAIESVDVLVTNPEDIERFFGIPGADPAQAAAAAAQQYQLLSVAMTLRQTPSVWRNVVTAVGHAGGRTVQAPSYEVEVVDRLGSGDAFVAGLLYGLLDGNLEKGLTYGTAMSALKHTIPGDFPWLTRAEVDGLIQGGGLRISR